MAKAGRPRKALKIPRRKITELSAIGCTVEEIAGICEVSKDTLERNFAAFIDKGRADGKVRLRRLQQRSANKGNVTMQIWLGKQLLGQSDKQELTGKDGAPLQFFTNVNFPEP